MTRRVGLPPAGSPISGRTPISEPHAESLAEGNQPHGNGHDHEPDVHRRPRMDRRRRMRRPDRPLLRPAGERPEARVVREAQARSICRECPVLLECRDWARRTASTASGAASPKRSAPPPATGSTCPSAASRATPRQRHPRRTAHLQDRVVRSGTRLFATVPPCELGRRLHSDGVDLDALRGWFAAEVDGATGQPLHAELISGGRSNLTYLVGDGTSEWVLRRPPLGHVLPTAHDMAREYTVIRALADTAVPVPHAYAFCDDPAVNGAPFYVMSNVDGVILRTPSTWPSSRTRRRRRVPKR